MIAYHESISSTWVKWIYQPYKTQVPVAQWQGAINILNLTNCGKSVRFQWTDLKYPLGTRWWEHEEDMNVNMKVQQIIYQRLKTEKYQKRFYIQQNLLLGNNPNCFPWVSTIKNEVLCRIRIQDKLYYNTNDTERKSLSKDSEAILPQSIMSL